MVDIVVTLLRWFGCTMLVIMFALAVAAAPRRCRAMAA